MLANFFFYLSEKTICFFGDQRPTIFFYVLSYAFPIMYANIWCFFWSTYIFSAHIFNKLFFLTFLATNYLFHFFSSPPPPPPDIKWCVPYVGIFRRYRGLCWLNVVVTLEACMAIHWVNVVPQSRDQPIRRYKEKSMFIENAPANLPVAEKLSMDGSQLTHISLRS